MCLPETQHCRTCLTLKKHIWTEEMRAQAFVLHLSQASLPSPNISSPAGDKNSDCSAAELYLDVSRADSDLRKIN